MHFYTLYLALLASTLPSTFATAAATAAVTEPDTDAVSTNNNLLARSDPEISTTLSSASIANLYAYSS
jgi:hypothetical protein